MKVTNKTAVFTPSKTYKTQSTLHAGISELLIEMGSWDSETAKNMGQMQENASVSYVISVTSKGRFFPIFLTKGFNMTMAHYIIENGFCVEAI